MVALRTRILGTLLVWLSAVITVATIAWFAINAAGRQVIAEPGALPLSGKRVAVTGDGEINNVPKSTDEAMKKSSSKSGVKSVQSPAIAASGKGAITQENGPASVVSTYSTIAGRVRVRCDGERIGLTGGYAQPDSGWAVKVEDDGPDQVWVRFDRQDRPSVLVMASCADGRPEFDQTRFDGDRHEDDNRDRNGDRDREFGW